MLWSSYSPSSADTDPWSHRSVRPLAVGDRIDTDIRGALRAGYPSLLVMTGVTGLGELVAIPPGDRPTYVGADLDVMRRDASAVRGQRPFVFANLKSGEGVADIVAWIERELLFDR